MVQDKQLSTNFSLYELLESQSATRNGIDEQFDPSDEIISNLEALCKNILQPLRDAIGVPIKISSGYRCELLNTMIGGAKSSQHLTGKAADISCPSIGNENLLKQIAALNLPFDQMINEFNYAWVHISFDVAQTRNQMLEAYKNDLKQTKYRELVV